MVTAKMQITRFENGSSQTDRHHGDYVYFLKFSRRLYLLCHILTVRLSFTNVCHQIRNGIQISYRDYCDQNDLYYCENVQMCLNIRIYYKYALIHSYYYHSIMLNMHTDYFLCNESNNKHKYRDFVCRSRPSLQNGPSTLKISPP